MTTAELITEIEQGEHAAELAPHWANVFQAPADPDPVEPPFDPVAPAEAESKEHVQWRATMRSRAVKRSRAGLLHPDAAYEIGKRLGVQPKLVSAAKMQRLFGVV